MHNISRLRIGFVLSLLLFFITTQVYALEAVGKVIASTGHVVADNKGEKRNLSRGGELYIGDKISTGSDARAHIRFADKTMLELEKNTIFIIDKYVFDQQNPSRDVQASSLLKGGFRTITGLISKQDPLKYKVNTPIATIGIRSTIFSLSLTGSNLHNMILWLTVFKGTACAAGIVETYNQCFSSDSNTPSAKITEKEAHGMGKIAISDMGQGGEDGSNKNSDENYDEAVSDNPKYGGPDQESFMQGDVKELDHDFTNSLGNPGAGGPPAQGSNGGSPGSDGVSQGISNLRSHPQ